jgi:hypothetical protein
MDTGTLIFAAAIGGIVWALVMLAIIKSAVKDALKETNDLLRKLDK